MDFSRIKKLVHESSNKFIILEGGEPELVVLSFVEYERLTQISGGTRESYRAVDEGTRPNFYPNQQYQQVDNFAPYLTQDEHREMHFPTASRSAGLPVRLEDIRLEDLPI